MKIYLITRILVPEYSAMPRDSNLKIETYAFSKKEYADAYMRLYSLINDRLTEVELDDKVPEMKQLVDDLAISIQSAIVVPCKVEN